MSAAQYHRVIPRDLFNEASLLKCYGQLWIALDNSRDHLATLEQADHGAFEILQGLDGDLSIDNVEFRVGGARYNLTRPLNSRRPWPLYVCGMADDSEFEPVEVFDDNGQLSAEFGQLIRHGAA